MQPIAPIEAVSEAEAKTFIYQHESSNRLDNVNEIGCYGLGQDCNNKLAIMCPDWQTNRECQDIYWDSYAGGRYGSWVGAYNFWMTHGYSCSNDVGWCGWW